MRRLLPLVALTACAMPPLPDPALADVPAAANQAVVVRPRARGDTAAELAAWERTAAGWSRALGPLPARVGRTGVIAAAEKREGDGHTPGGVFAFGTAFGDAPTLATGLRYRQATAQDWWVDEPKSPAYNTWVTGKPDVSAEALRRDDGLYATAAVLEYNTAPIVPGRGSAIFLHVWAAPEVPTSGCVALSAGDVRRLLGWLQAGQRPVISIAVE